MNNLNVGPLAARALIEVRGADAQTLLQGQLSTDLRDLTPLRSPLSSLNSPKGRLLATLFLHALPDGTILLELPAVIADSTRQRLQLFVLRSQVSLAICPPEQPPLWGVVGDDAADALRAAGLPVPESVFDAISVGDLQIARRPGVSPRYLLIGPHPFTATVGDLSSRWRAEDIAAGIANIYPETRDHFVAPTAGIASLGGISYTKGCYTGQEVIARLHYLGQAKRQVYGLRLANSAAPGDRVLEGDAAVGEIVDSVEDANGSVRALAVLQIDHANVRCTVNDGAIFELEPR